MQKIKILTLAALAMAAAVVAAPAPTPTPWNGQTLHEGLPLLGQSFGQKLAAGKNCRDRRFWLFPAGAPIRIIQTKLLQFVPKKPGTARWYQDGSVVAFDEDLLSVEERKRAGLAHAQAEQTKREKGFADFAQWAKGSPKYSRWARLFQGLPEAARMAALRGKPGVQVPVSALSAPLQHLVRQIEPGAVLSEKDRSGRVHVTYDSEKDPTFITFLPYRQGSAEPGLAMIVGSKDGHGRILQDISALPLKRPGQDDDVPDWGYRSRLAEKTTRRHPDRLDKDMAKFPELARDLNQKVRLHEIPTGFALWAGDVWKQVSEQTHIPLIGEYDSCRLDPYQIAPTVPKWIDASLVPEWPLWKLLDRACQQYDLTWDYQGGWLEVRSPRTVESWLGLVDLSPTAPHRMPPPEGGRPPEPPDELKLPKGKR